MAGLVRPYHSILLWIIFLFLYIFLNMFLFPLFIVLLKKEKLVVDSKVYIYAMGMSQAFFKPNELPVLKQ